MKLRNLLMTAALLLAVSATFATKGTARFAWNSTVLVGTTSPACLAVGTSNTCRTEFTGPQCTTYAYGADRLMYDFPIPAGTGPICVTPLRQIP